jgi:hypothetical protein
MDTSMMDAKVPYSLSEAMNGSFLAAFMGL